VKKILKYSKFLESKYYSDDDMNYVLDKMSRHGKESLSKIELNILNSISTDDERIEDIIRLLSELSNKCKYYMDMMRNNKDQSLDGNEVYMKKWTQCSREMTRYENILKNNFGLDHTDYKLNND